MRLDQADGTITTWGGEGDLGKIAAYVWNTGNLTWEKMEQPAAGGGGGAVTIADGADVTQGAQADGAVTSDVGGSVSGKLRGLVKWAFERMPAALGQTTMANSLPVAIASNQSAVPISAASLPLPTGAATAAGQLPNSHDVTVDNGAGAAAVNIQDGGNSITVDDGGGSVTVDGTVTANPTRPATATLSNVNDTNVSTTLLAANANRLGATIHNDSTAVLYVKFGATASTTSFTVKMVADAYYEVPFWYTGRIDGIWASDASGAARVTELTA